MNENLTAETPERDVSVILWLGLPLLSLAVCWISPLMGRERWTPTMMTEVGFWENATVVLLLAALSVCVLLLDRRRRYPRAMAPVLAMVLLCTIYFTGEEASWGQHWLGFRSPESVARANSQREFNLHNLKGDALHTALNSGPKRLAGWAAGIGGVLLPLAMIRWRPKIRRNHPFWHFFLPTWRIAPASAMFVVGTVPSILIKRFAPHWRQSDYVDLAFVIPSEEYKECIFALVVLLYVVSLLVRGRAQGLGK